MSFGPPEHPRPSHEPIPPISDVGKATDTDVEMEERNLTLLRERAARAQADFAQAASDIAQAQVNLKSMKGDA